MSPRSTAPLLVVKARLNNFASTFDQRNGTSKQQHVMKVMRTVLRKTGNLARYMVQHRTKALRDGAKMRLFRSYSQLGLPMPAFLENIPVRTVYMFARNRYRPETPFDGELALFAATSGVGFDEPFRNRYVDPLMGWNRRATRGVRAFDVPGGHSSMLQEPNVRVVAKYLQSYINEVVNRPMCMTTPGAIPAVGPVTARAHFEPTGESSIMASGLDSPCRGELTTDVVIQAAPALDGPAPSRPFHLLLVSAESRTAMECAAERLADHLKEHEDQELSDVSYSLAVGQRQFEWRRVAVGASREELIERLRKGAGRGAWSGSEPTVQRPVAFVLAGIGEQAAGTGRGLYDGEPAFRAAADQCAEILKPFLGQDIREAMFAEPKPSRDWLRGGGSDVLKDARIAQPAAFVLDWALAQMWLTWGIKPAALLGYSVGEYVAAVLAGVLRLADALEIVARRAALIREKAKPGVMLAVPLGECELRPRLGNDLWFAAINGPQATVVGGQESAIQRLEKELQSMEVVARRVASEQGSHTPLLDPVRNDLKQLVEKARRDEPRISLWSNVTGAWLTAADVSRPLLLV